MSGYTSGYELLGPWYDGQCAQEVSLKGIYPEFQVIRGFSQKIPADLLSYDKIHS